MNAYSASRGVSCAEVVPTPQMTRSEKSMPRHLQAKMAELRKDPGKLDNLNRMVGCSPLRSSQECEAFKALDIRLVEFWNEERASTPGTVSQNRDFHEKYLQDLKARFAPELVPRIPFHPPKSFARECCFTSAPYQSAETLKCAQHRSVFAATEDCRGIPEPHFNHRKSEHSALERFTPEAQNEELRSRFKVNQRREREVRLRKSEIAQQTGLAKRNALTGLSKLPLKLCTQCVDWALLATPQAVYPMCRLGSLSYPSSCVPNV
eukprot:1177153-Prorocentrum_minimum.AAC.4